MNAPACPHCDGPGHLATNVLFDLWRCTKCHKEYWAQHATCQYPSCASWVDHEDSGLCWYHAAQHGIQPELQPKDPTLCHAADCTREITDHGAGLCDYHAWDANHKPENQ